MRALSVALLAALGSASCAAILGLEAGERIPDELFPDGARRTEPIGDGDSSQPREASSTDAPPPPLGCTPEPVRCVDSDAASLASSTARGDCPLQFSEALTLSAAGPQALVPSIASDGEGSAIVAWEESRRGPNEDIPLAMRVSTNDGLFFAPETFLGNPGPSSDNDAPTVVRDPSGGYVLVWRGLDSSQNTGTAVWASRSSTPRGPFSAPVRATSTRIKAIYAPSVFVDGTGTIFVAFQANSRLVNGRVEVGPQIHVVSSSDHGVTWSPETTLPNTDLPVHPRIAVAGQGDVWVTYVTERGQPWGSNGNVVFAARRRTGFTSFDAPVPLSGGMSVVPDPSSMAIQGSQLFLAFVVGDRRTATRVMLARSPNGGTTWEPLYQLDDDNCQAIHLAPELRSGASGKIHAVYLDNRLGQYSFTVWYTESTNGIDFLPSSRVFDKTTRTVDPFGRYRGLLTLDVRGGRSLVGWSAFPNGTNGEVRLARGVAR